MNEQIWTIKSLLTWSTQYFSDKNIESPRLTSELLLSKALNQNRLYLYTNFSQPLNKNELADYKVLLKRRVNGEPTAYILEEKEFWSLKFKVNKNVLIPRPETEILVEIVNDFISKRADGNILEIGSGCGNIATALAYDNKHCKVFSVDISFEALSVAKYNIHSNNACNNVFLINGDILFPLKNEKKFDFLVSNPPYIKDEDIHCLQTEIKKFEPMTALEGGSDGLYFYKKILSNAKNYLKEDGMIFFEFGKKEQGEDIKKIMLDFSYKHIVIKNDYSNTPRVIYCSVS